MVMLKLFFIFLAICIAEPAKILGIFPTPAVSHFTLGFRLMKELADRGHEVTMVSPFPQKTPIANYTDVAVESMTEALDEYKKDFFNRETMCFTRKIKFIHNMGYSLTEKLLSHDNFQKLLKSQAKFDVVIVEYFLAEAILGVGKVFDAPVVLFSSLPSYSSSNNIFANPAPSSYVPHILTQYTGYMDLGERFVNLAYNTFDAFYKYYYMFPLHDKLLKTYISKDLDLEDVMHNASLILLNSHPSISEPVPHVPNMIEIGGFHVKPPNELRLDLQMFMDEAVEGVVIFSMGSNLKSSDFSEQKLQAVLKSFGKIKQRVLWKFEEDSLPGLPSNVKLMKWLPQQDLLAHPNTKLFISHGGMLSTIETVHYGVPVIGIPIYGDQKMNVAKAERNGYAISVPFQNLSEEKLSGALHEILNNPKYADNAKTRSKILKDQLVSPMDTAVFWIEYAMRHKGSHHLQSAGIHLSWYKRNMIDIIIILTVVDILLFLIFYYIIKHIIHQISRIKRRPSKKYKKLEKD
ncbi:UDP-glucuronosyltransferase 2B10 [Anoplophora glabripennis]|nr:UDP-glucuronosyltransferase 2B10 [Anoplophora glabripennis]XP_018563299.1 UDP-glucuronosyltransferase 2B10 [Anoplophora glabripennis]